MVRATKAGKISAFRVDKEFRVDPAAVRLALSNNARSKRQLFVAADAIRRTRYG